jgi:hypothetical protein
MIDTAMTRTDAFLFAIKRAMEKRRAHMDVTNVQSLQIGITLSRDGQANVTIQTKEEYTVVDCFEGTARVDRFMFQST